jgi:hypothetical protein
MRLGRLICLMLVCAAAGTAATAALAQPPLPPLGQGAVAFRGAWLQQRAPEPLTHSGPAFPRIYCAPRTVGFCTGWITIRARGKVIGRAPLAIRSHDGPSVQVPITGGGRAMVRRARRLPTSVTIRVHDGQGLVRTWRGRLVLTPPR